MTEFTCPEHQMSTFQMSNATDDMETQRESADEKGQVQRRITRTSRTVEIEGFTVPKADDIRETVTAANRIRNNFYEQQGRSRPASLNSEDIHAVLAAWFDTEPTPEKT